MVIEARLQDGAEIVPSGTRRIFAWMVDYFVVAVYMGVLFFATFVLTRVGLELDAIKTPAARQLVGALTLTIPVILYFAIAESSKAQGTIGKLATRLKVTDRNLNRITFGRSLARSMLKFLPWELAHTFVHRVPKTGEIPSLAWAALVGSFALALVYLIGLFVRPGRTLYDVLAGTRVVQSHDFGAWPGGNAVNLG
jgi:uncharacterized RDD family membrane protein YckC